MVPQTGEGNETLLARVWSHVYKTVKYYMFRPNYCVETVNWYFWAMLSAIVQILLLSLTAYYWMSGDFYYNPVLSPLPVWGLYGGLVLLLSFPLLAFVKSGIRHGNTVLTASAWGALIMNLVSRGSVALLDVLRAMPFLADWLPSGFAASSFLNILYEVSFLGIGYGLWLVSHDDGMITRLFSWLTGIESMKLLWNSTNMILFNTIGWPWNPLYEINRALSFLPFVIGFCWLLVAVIWFGLEALNDESLNECVIYNFVY